MLPVMLHNNMGGIRLQIALGAQARHKLCTPGSCCMHRW